jgi:hypothetical protein
MNRPNRFLNRIVDHRLRTYRGLIFLELKYFHNHCVASGAISRSTKLFDWVTRWFRLLAEYGLPQEFSFKASKSSGYLNEHIVECHGFLTLLLLQLSVSQVIPVMKIAAVSALRAFVPFVLLGVPLDSSVSVVLPGSGETLALDRHGRVSGWSWVISNDTALLSARWNHYSTTGAYGYTITSPSESPQLMDCILFAAALLHDFVRGTQCYNVGSIAMTVLVNLMSGALRTTLRSMCVENRQQNGSARSAPVTLRFPGSTRNRRHDPNAVWTLLRKADNCRLPISEVIQISASEPQFHIGPSRGWIWMAFRVNLLMEKSMEAFRNPAPMQLSLSLDPSTHSGQHNGDSCIFLAAQTCNSATHQNHFTCKAASGAQVRVGRRCS